jgi:hypothetical protein
MESGRHSTGPHLDDVFGNNIKGKISPLRYLVDFALAFVLPWIGPGSEGAAA